MMLEALAPVPGLDAERLLDVMEGSDIEAADPRDIKIVHLAKKVCKAGLLAFLLSSLFNALLVV